MGFKLVELISVTLVQILLLPVQVAVLLLENDLFPLELVDGLGQLGFHLLHGSSLLVVFLLSLVFVVSDSLDLFGQFFLVLISLSLDSFLVSRDRAL